MADAATDAARVALGGGVATLAMSAVLLAGERSGLMGQQPVARRPKPGLIRSSSP